MILSPSSRPCLEREIRNTIPVKRTPGIMPGVRADSGEIYYIGILLLDVRFA